MIIGLVFLKRSIFTCAMSEQKKFNIVAIISEINKKINITYNTKVRPEIIYYEY